MRPRWRLYAARFMALLFLAVGGYKTWLIYTQPDPFFVVDAVMYLGLAWIWNEIARKENRK